MNIIELLALKGLDTSKKIKLVRHQDQNISVYDLMTAGYLETYQACQANPILKNCDLMVSFIGLPNNKARLYGVYRVLNEKHVRDIELPASYPLNEKPDTYFYELAKEPGFEELEERVVIDWGGGPRSWHQWLSPKTVLEVLPKGYTRPFPGYLDFILSFDELSKIIDHPESNRDWVTSLSNVAGIYLILQPSTGAQYVGSAYGNKGLYGRWMDYKKTGHGGNKLLKEIFDTAPKAHHEFKFSILRTLPKSLTPKEVLKYENFYKEKLGSRAYGLNQN